MGTRVLIIAVVVLAGCEKTSTRYCEIHGATDPASCGYMDAPIDTPKACTGDPDCTPGRCDQMTKQCVQCLSGSDCAANMPFCEPQTHTCGACRTNSDCADSHACTLEGQCADAANVIYVDSGTGKDTNQCTQAAPCKTIAGGLAKVTTTRATMKLSGAFDEAVIFKMIKVALVADPGTTLTSTAGGSTAITFMMANSSVQIRDLEILHPTKDGVNIAAGNSLVLRRVSVHDAVGVGIIDNGSLELSQSQVYSNATGGLTMGMGARFIVTNNFIHHNGTIAKDAGGVVIPATTGQSVLEFNTIVDNAVKGGGMDAGGVACSAPGFMAPNNIIARNASAGSTTNAAANVSPTSTCNFTGSSTDLSDVTTLHFLNPDGTSGWDYHLGSGSVAIDASTVNSTVTEDFDGDTRPDGSAKDLGADEY